ncbi:signal recognition particle protein [Mycoplasma phocoenae]|uniref:Signal recognition particle protein n=1 Tax=Mycoplasma phocoenae TaxID=754517 RepID=A0A858U4U6_9MOLU|nr:signal recognition particle protein [Mycoplasma phocoenae]QJG67071.1 signal recognition particle protein [Mycoplasma phocoenae]
MFDFIGNRLQKSIQKMNKKTLISESDILEILREVKLSLLEADVNLEVVKKFTKEVKTKILESGKIGNLDAQQTVIKIFNEELINILGQKTVEVKIKNKPTIIMMIGLQGSGKTTTSAKLAAYLRKKKIAENPLLIGADIYRPAARDQLESLSKQINCNFYTNRIDDALQISKEAVSQAKNNKNDLLIIDTAGRLSIDETLMDELKSIKKYIKPDYIFLVVDAMSGQDVINVAKTFHENLNLNGTIITKLDSDARGGAALSITHLLNIPINFIGTSEKISGLEVFHPDRMAKRILGMGDFVSLIENAQENIDESKAKKLGNRFMSGQFSLDDLMETMAQIKKLGKMSKLLKMIPGIANKIDPSQIDKAEEKFRMYEILISSMTKEERKNPKLLKDSSRKNRIMKGSGRSAKEFNLLLADYERIAKQMKDMASGRGGLNPNIMGGLSGLF